MPELPEVETVARQLEPLLLGRRVARLDVRDTLLKFDAAAVPVGARIASTRRVGKQVVIELGAGGDVERPSWLVIHLRMTGRLVWEDCPLDAARRKPLRFEITLDRGALRFFDTRRFGTLRLCRSPEEFAPSGLDPLTRALNQRRLNALLERATGEIKPWLLRQDKIVGIGNIYASEILFESSIDPRRAGRDLTADERRRLLPAIKRVLRRAIQHCGTTFSDFQDAHGVTGAYQNYLRVYGREGEPCRRCKAPIERLTQQQRSTFFCSNCQL